MSTVLVNGRVLLRDAGPEETLPVTMPRRWPKSRGPVSGEFVDADPRLGFPLSGSGRGKTAANLLLVAAHHCAPA